MNEDILDSMYLINKKHRQRIMLSELPKDSLFLYKRQVWRSMGILIEGHHSVTAQRVSVSEDGTEVVEQNADFTKYLLVEPYDGKLPKKSEGRKSISDYQLRKEQGWV